MATGETGSTSINSFMIATPSLTKISKVVMSLELGKPFLISKSVMLLRFIRFCHAELVLLPNRAFVHLGVVSGLLLPVVME